MWVCAICNPSFNQVLPILFYACNYLEFLKIVRHTPIASILYLVAKYCMRDNGEEFDLCPEGKHASFKCVFIFYLFGFYGDWGESSGQTCMCFLTFPKLTTK